MVKFNNFLGMKSMRTFSSDFSQLHKQVKGLEEFRASI